VLGRVSPRDRAQPLFAGFGTGQIDKLSPEKPSKPHPSFLLSIDSPETFYARSIAMISLLILVVILTILTHLVNTIGAQTINNAVCRPFKSLFMLVG
jgi:hypothetical protein